jgi:hypothetical protein
MSRLKLSVLLTTLTLCFCFAVSANAAPRAFVAVSGNDGNNCSSLSPCKTIMHALSVVDSKGEVVISESGEYDNFVIAQSVTVAAAPGIYAGITANTQDGVRIIRLSIDDIVVLRNLTIKGTAAIPEISGINNSTVGNLFIDGCNISGVTYGIWNTAPGKTTVHDTTVRNCQIGININSPVGFINWAVVDNSRAERNNTGITIGSNARVTVHNSILFANSTGVRVSSILQGIQAEATIESSVFHVNGIAITVVGGSGGTGLARLSKNTISKNLTGVNVTASGTAYSLQDNLIAGNDVDIAGALTPLSHN